MSEPIHPTQPRPPSPLSLAERARFFARRLWSKARNLLVKLKDDFLQLEDDEENLADTRPIRVRPDLENKPPPMPPAKPDEPKS